MQANNRKEEAEIAKPLEPTTGPPWKQPGRFAARFRFSSQELERSLSYAAFG
jgi:hypothetical protein